MFVTIYFGLILYVNCVYNVLHSLSTQMGSSDEHGGNGRKQEVSEFLGFVVAGIGDPKHLGEVIEAEAHLTLFVLAGVGVEQDLLNLQHSVEALTVLSVLGGLVSLEPEGSLAELLTVDLVQIASRGFGLLKRSLGGQAGCLQDQVREELSPVYLASVAAVHVAHHSLHGLQVHELPRKRHTVVISSKLFGIVDLRHHDVDQFLEGEEFGALEALDGLKFVVKALQLRDGEFVVTLVLHALQLWWGGGDEVEDRLVHGEVHELDTELILDFGLSLNGVLNHDA